MSKLLQDDVELFLLLLSFVALGFSLSGLWVIFASTCCHGESQTPLPMMKEEEKKTLNMVHANDKRVLVEKDEGPLAASTSTSKNDGQSVVLLSWSGISCSYLRSKKQTQRTASEHPVETVHGFYGKVHAGELTAIMGSR